MAIKDHKKTSTAMWICMIWMILALIAAACIGILGAVYFQKNVTNPETIFLELSNMFFNPWIEGVLLAAVLSAVMSTVAAQLLQLSSAFSVDVYAKFFRKTASHRELLNISRLAVAVVTVAAIIMSYNPDSSILSLVSFAWAGLGSAFGSVVVFSLFWPRMNKFGAGSGIIVGAVVVLIWPMFANFGGWFEIYSMVPAFTLSCVSIVLVSLLTAAPDKEISDEFKRYQEIL
jgi:sodium/proline symporter